MHLSSDGKKIDDYMLASTGAFASESAQTVNAAGSPLGQQRQLAEYYADFMQRVTSRDPQGLIAMYEGLPEILKNSRNCFSHYLQAVMNTEPLGSERHTQAMTQFPLTIAHPMPQAIFRMNYAAQSGDLEGYNAEREKLVSWIDDYWIVD